MYSVIVYLFIKYFIVVNNYFIVWFDEVNKIGFYICIIWCRNGNCKFVFCLESIF